LKTKGGRAEKRAKREKEKKRQQVAGRTGFATKAQRTQRQRSDNKER
jgi:hypothetical protein